MYCGLWVGPRRLSAQPRSRATRLVPIDTCRFGSTRGGEPIEYQVILINPRYLQSELGARRLDPPLTIIFDEYQQAELPDSGPHFPHFVFELELEYRFPTMATIGAFIIHYFISIKLALLS